MSEDKKRRFVTVGIETSLGAHYLFPDMDMAVLSQLLPKFSDRRPPNESFTLVNASTAVLILPVRVIKKVTVSTMYESGSKITEDWWHAPLHELQNTH
jgi:hypothetical protein